TAVAVMLLGVLLFHQQSAVALYPLVLGAVSIVASIIGTFAVRSKAGNVERALYQGLVVSGGLAALAFLPITYWLMHGLNYGAVVVLRHGVVVPSATGFHLGASPWWHYYFCALIGLVITAFLFVITDYYTSIRFSPVRS